MPEIILRINDDSLMLNPAELADFLFFFRAANSALKRIVSAEDLTGIRKPGAKDAEIYAKKLGGFRPEELNNFFDAHTDPDIVQIANISRNSPLEIVVCGCHFLLVLAVIFSGGKIAISGKEIRAELPPLGKGISNLRQALGLDRTLRAGFGIKDSIIKLNKNEFDALMMQAPETKNQGGFQGFLVGLQLRINRQTRELKLSEYDLERIYRYKQNPGKGGWQSRFKKIFGRHFPTDE